MVNFKLSGCINMKIGRKRSFFHGRGESSAAGASAQRWGSGCVGFGGQATDNQY
jgi:hypothetical protein